MSLKRFLKDYFERLSDQDRIALLGGLATALRERLQQSHSNFHGSIEGIVSELRSLGHDLWSYDEDDEFEIWGPDYSKPNGPGIVLTFRAHENVVAEWSPPQA